MAYARWGEEGSKVYVFRGDKYNCCHLGGGKDDKTFSDLPSLLAHLENDHMAKGEIVPLSCIERIKAEINGRDPMEYGKKLLEDAKKELGIKD